MQGEGDHPTLAAKRKGSERSGGLHGTQSGSPESGVMEWRKPGETPCARVEAGLLVGFDLEAAQRRMHSGTPHALSKQIGHGNGAAMQSMEND